MSNSWRESERDGYRGERWVAGSEMVVGEIDCRRV
jgi:hypothetical protein